MAEVDDTIARMLAGADLLMVIADKLEEESTETVMKKTASLAAETYRSAGEILSSRGYTLNAREAYQKAERAYKRGGHPRLAREMIDRAIWHRPENGNIYADD